jgi:hypothetical protein
VELVNLCDELIPPPNLPLQPRVNTHHHPERVLPDDDD